MSEQDDLFTYRYPNAPGFKRDGTSQEAAESMESVCSFLQRQCLEALTETNRTADEVAGRLNISILTIRPRMSELVAKAKIVDSGERRLNTSGKRAVVWRVA